MIREWLQWIIYAFRFVYQNIAKSLRLQFILIVLVSVVFAMLVGGITEDIFSTTENHYVYPSQMELQQELKEMVPSIQLMRSDQINQLLNRYAQKTGTQLFIINPEGNVLYHSENVSQRRVDLFRLQSSIIRQDEGPSDVPGSRLIYALYSFRLKSQNVYFVAIEESDGDLETYQKVNPFLTMISAILAFIFVYILLTGKKLRQIEIVTKGMHEIANGNFRFRLKEQGQDEISSLAAHVNNMAKKLEENREKEQQLERERTELITSISHDLRTPLTSVIGYLKLIHDNPHLTKEEVVSYTKIALSKSEKLKQMIDDLFDYTKLTHHHIQLQTETVSINKLLNQLLEESFMLSEQKDLEVERMFCEDSLMVRADPLLLVRMFDNLIHNVVRYARRPGKMVLKTQEEENVAVIQISNSAESIDPDTFHRLFEVFVMGDKSRSKDGSGLGLAIVKRIVELHQGTIQAEQRNGMITFRIHLPLAVT